MINNYFKFDVKQFKFNYIILILIRNSYFGEFKN